MDKRWKPVSRSLKVQPCRTNVYVMVSRYVCAGPPEVEKDDFLAGRSPTVLDPPDDDE